MRARGAVNTAAWTAILAVCLTGGVFSQTTVIPPVPANLVAQSPPELQPRVLLSWNSSVGTWFFRIYRSTGDTTSFRWIGVAQANKFEDQGVIAGTQYYYYVTAAQFADSLLRESKRSNMVGIRAYSLPPGPKGIMTGRVVDQISGLPIPKVRIRFFKMLAATDRLVEAATDPSGWYTALLDTGRYLVRAEELAVTVTQAAHIPEWFDDAPKLELATPVAVRFGDTARVNFALSPGTQSRYAYISGIVTDDQGIPLSGAAVAFVRPIQEMNAYAALTATSPGTGPEAQLIPGIGYTRGVVWVGFTNPSGKFFAQVVAGRSYVGMAAMVGFNPVLYENTTDPTQATILRIDADTSGINFSLTSKSGGTSSMQGMIRDEEGSEVPARIILFPRPKGGEDKPAVFVHTDSTGTFELNDLPPGTYTILTIPFGDCSPGYYKEGTTSVVSWIDADTVVVNGSPAALTVTLPRLRSEGLTRISGRVLSVNHTGLPGVRIVARTSAGTIAGYGLSDRTGAYEMEAVTSGALTLFVDRFQFNLVQSPLTVPQNTYALTNVDFVLTSSYPTGVEAAGTLPVTTLLHQNFPNPFNPSTTIRYDVGEEASVELRVYDVIGREVATLASGVHQVGRYVTVLDGSHLSSGVYFCVLRVNGSRSYTRTTRMLLMK
ncbi:MAG: Por secretion system C-terminal sorting protein [Bacteroidetes bacterium]|jgi:hypothetical protein|nr:Por secretion system C-terminal sorting protein [Bacteroidota bacterium]